MRQYIIIAGSVFLLAGCDDAPQATASAPVAAPAAATPATAASASTTVAEAPPQKYRTWEDTPDEGPDAVQQTLAGAVDAADTAKATAGEAGDHVGGLAHAAKEHTFSLTDHVTGWLTPTEKQPPQRIPASYCYRTVQDILCYRLPMPGWENRLVAYQGTDAEPPPPAMMELMPKGKVDNSTLPEVRAANAKPIYKAPPPAAADDKKPADAPAVLDSSHQQLPDPLLSPQL